MPNWKKVIVSGSDAALSSLNVDGALTASGLIYPTSDGTSEQVLTTDGLGNLSFADLPSEDVTTTVKNLSGTTLTKGTPVHAVSGSSSGNVTPVIAASASDATTMPATFILGEELADEAEGTGIAVGSITGVDTSAFTVGDIVYVGEDGGYTNVKPTSSGNLIQNLGVVTKVHASNGAGFIYGSGRSNDVPNLPTGKIWVGTSNYTVTSSFVHLDESNGRLGIGDTSPTRELTVNGDIGVKNSGRLYLWDSHNSNYIQYDKWTTSASSGMTITNQASTGNLSLQTVSSTRLFISASGNVGIGTTSPTFTLDVPNGSARFNDIRLNDGRSLSSTAGGSSYVVLSPNDGDIVINASANTKGIDLQLGAGNVIMSVTGSNVGIGTTSPSQKLHVVGNTTITGVTYTDYIQTYSGNSIQLRHQDATPIVHVDTDTGRVGIGNTAPPKELTVEGSISASGDLFASRGTFEGVVEMGGDLIVDGIVTAREFHTDFVSASIIYSSGSTKFGDTSDDIHEFTGSVVVNNKFLVETTGGSDWFSVGNVGSGIVAFNTQGGAAIAGPNAANQGARFNITTGAVGTKGLSLYGVSSQSSSLFEVSSVAGANGDILTVSASGNIGIGTATPGYKLQVAGNTKIDDDVYFFNTVLNPASNFANQRGAGFDASSGKFEIAASEIPLEISRFSTTGPVLSVRHSGSQVATIDTDGGAWFSGDVGIGTNSPATELDVSGSIRMSAPGPVLSANSTNQQSGLRLNVTNLTSGADLIRFQNNGTTLLKVKENGNVGIGNNLTATEKLHISGGNVLIETDSGAELNLKNTSSGVQWQVVSGYNGGFEIGDVTNSRTDSSAPFFISSGAQVGIGTTSPSANVHISGSNPSLKIQDGNTGTLVLNADYASSGNDLIESDTNNLRISAAGGSKYVSLWTAGSEKVRITSTGAVGIGTSAPTQKLEVRDGNLVVSSSNSEVVIGTSSGKPRMQSNGNQDLLFSTANQTNVLYLQDANGRVGIGTTSPTKKLTVEGAISASSGFYGDGSNLTGITTSDGLADVLENNNSAGGFSIDMNSNDITNVGEVQATIFNGPSASLSYVTASAGLFVDAPVTLRDGSTSDLALNFSSSANTGFYISQYGAGSGKQVNIRVGGSNIASFNSAGISSNANVYTGTGGQFRNYAGVWKATTGTSGGDAQFILNGKTIMHLDETDEFVGIGTTTPSQKLHVSGNVLISDRLDVYSDFRIRGNSTLTNQGVVRFFTNSSNTLFIDADNSGANLFKFYANGDLTVPGIITAQEFHTEFVSASIVYSSGSTKFGDTQDDNHSFTGSIQINYPAGGTPNLLTLYGNRNSNDTEVGILFKDRNAVAGGQEAARIYSQRQGSGADFDLVFATSDAGGTDTLGEAMRIDHVGKVGIGTTSPSEALHVSGTVAITDTATVRQTAKVQTGDPGGVTLESFDATTYFGAFLDYVVYDVDKNNMRSGTIQIVFDENGNVQHTDNSTADIGDTTGAYFDTTSSGTSARLWYYADSTEWFVRYHLRYL